MGKMRPMKIFYGGKFVETYDVETVLSSVDSTLGRVKRDRKYLKVEVFLRT